ncbi:hypothetical protein ACJJTC_001988 [Scirpophaga incertulas]
MSFVNNDARKSKHTFQCKGIVLEIEPSKTTKFPQNGFLTIPNRQDIKQYIAVILCGLLLWSTSWFLFKDLFSPSGYMFHMVGVVFAGYFAGHTLERYTTINPVVGMTLTGALYRNFGPENFLINDIANVIDLHLRRIYPVIILTRGPLCWNWTYIKSNSLKVFSLATLPWITDCLSVAFLTHLLLGFPWYWGLHLGSILASVSPAIVVPTVNRHGARGYGTKNQIALLVGNAGGLDTAFTEGIFGVLNCILFVKSTFTYKIVKAGLAVFLGIGVGILWGVLVDSVPDHKDPAAPALRSLLVFGGGFLLTYASAYFGWGGTSGVAIMVCASTAATRWARRDWPINNNPVSEIYRVLWLVFEPMLFTLTGYYFDGSSMTLTEFGLILASIFGALFLRILTAFLLCLANELSIKESLFVAITWIPKAIVEAVLVRVASDSIGQEAKSQDKQIALQHSNIIVIAILITSTIGSALTTITGPLLLSADSSDAPQEPSQQQNPHRNGVLVRRNTVPGSLYTVDTK